ncbi:MAG: heterodisulfide reductase-related iron-sulfur binding cluster [ANME-2 cluster archaeon]|nr:heterodisulfide reductase-related iron-sulfur binding cluster [ANME-2 cluster archaeon]
MEKSIRMVLSELGIQTTDLEGTTCCPTKSIAKVIGSKTWHLTGARNLALAEAAGLDILTPCNGCFSSLKSVVTDLNMDLNLRDSVNQELGRVGLEYTGKVNVKHLVQVLHDDVTAAEIKKRVVKPFTGMKLAVHYGCHMVRPSSAIHFDDPNRPSKFDVLVQATGARSVDYLTKMMCCGNDLNTAGESDGAIAMSREKLLETQRIADGMTMACPACFTQYDSKQYLMQKSGEHIDLPIIYLTELLGLSFGFSPEEMGKNMHRVDTTPFLEKWEQRTAYLEEVRNAFDLDMLDRCYQCGACLDDCPVVKINPDFNPNRVIGDILAGKMEDVLSGPDVWRCVSCYTCFELCPQKFGMNKVFERLKQLTYQMNITPEGVDGGIRMLLETGRLGEPTAMRKKLKIPELPKGGSNDLRILLELDEEDESQ